MRTGGRRVALSLVLAFVLAAGVLTGLAAIAGPVDDRADGPRTAAAVFVDARDDPAAVLVTNPGRRWLPLAGSLALLAVVTTAAPRRWTRRVQAPATAPDWTLVRAASWASRAPPAAPRSR